MKWIHNPREQHPQPNCDYYLVSECFTYTISKFFICGECFYEAWRGKELIATRLPSADAAKALVVQQEEG